MKKFLLSFLLTAALGVGANAQIQGYSVGQAVTDFTVTDTDSQSHTLSSYASAGKWILLDFFFDTCPPCQSTTPIFNELHEKYGCNDGDLICLSVNNGTDNDAQVIAFENTYGGTFSHAPAVSADGGAGAVDTDFNPAAYPTYCLIGPDMQLKNADIWPINSVADFENAFGAAGFSPTAMTCGANNINEHLIGSFQIFPNPANDQVNLRYELTKGADVTVTLYNVLGAVVKQNTVGAGVGTQTYTMMLDDVNNGQYFVEVRVGNDEIKTQKLNVMR